MAVNAPKTQYGANKNDYSQYGLSALEAKQVKKAQEQGSGITYYAAGIAKRRRNVQMKAEALADWYDNTYLPSQQGSGTMSNPFAAPDVNYNPDLGSERAAFANNPEAQKKYSLNNKDYSNTLRLAREADRYNSKPRQTLQLRGRNGQVIGQHQVDKPELVSEDVREQQQQRQLSMQTKTQQIQQTLLKDRNRFDVLMQQWGLGRLATTMYNLIGQDPAFANVVFPILIGKPSEPMSKYLEDQIQNELYKSYLAKGMDRGEAWAKATREVQMRATVEANSGTKDNKRSS